MIFYYVRHGEPIYSPSSLTEYGVRQAEALAKRFVLYGLDEIYSSPSGRALQTAKPTCEMLNLKPKLLSWTDEGLAYKDFSIKRDDKTCWVFQDQAFIERFSSNKFLTLEKIFIEDTYFAKTNIKSGLERIRKETRLFLYKLGFKYNYEKGGYKVVKPNNKRIALFAHQGFGLAFLSILLNIPYNIFCTKFDMGHSGVTAIYFDETKVFSYPKLLQLSNDSHLYKEGILNGYQGFLDI